MTDKKQKLKPGYFNQKPLLKVISHVKDSVGLQDSCIQTNQAAIQLLEEHAEKSTDPVLFIQNLCKKNKISIGTSDLEYFKRIQYKSYILQTYNFIEPFFKELILTYQYYNNFEGEWKKKDGDKELDLFNQLLNNLDNSKKKKIKSYPEYYLLDYYRLVRNSIVHLSEDKDQNKKTSRYYTSHLADKLSHFKESYELEAPNEPDKINFDDFKLYTRSIKYFSNILNDICFPDISTLILVAKKDNKLQKKLLQTRNIKFEGDLLRRIKSLNSYFKEHFNETHLELRDEFCNLYLASEGIDINKFNK